MSSAQGQKETGEVFLYRLYMAELSLFCFSQSIFDVRERNLQTQGKRWTLAANASSRQGGASKATFTFVLLCRNAHTNKNTHVGILPQKSRGQDRRQLFFLYINCTSPNHQCLFSSKFHILYSSTMIFLFY